MRASASLLPFDRELAPSQASGASPGLVTYKTTAHEQLINLGPSAVAERRVRRLKRSVWASGHLHRMADKGFRPCVPWFVTLTYVGVSDWRPEHIAEAIKRFRNWCRSKRVECRYTWVAELQRRGAVHYHLLAWLPVGVHMPHWDRPSPKRGGIRAPFWPHGMTETEVARSGVGYLMKYLSKLGELTRFPKGLRLYGIGGLTQDGRSVRSWYNLPQWAKAAYGVGELLRAGVGLVIRATGEILPPVWRITRIPSGLVIKKLRDVAPRFAADVIPHGEYPGAFSSFLRGAA
jgi:hypothetical protein